MASVLAVPLQLGASAHGRLADDPGRVSAEMLQKIMGTRASPPPSTCTGTFTLARWTATRTAPAARPRKWPTTPVWPEQGQRTTRTSKHFDPSWSDRPADAPLLWATNEPVPDAPQVWQVLTGMHPDTGLVPILLAFMGDEHEGRP